MAFNAFVLGTDFSAGAERALESAVLLARRIGASVHLVHVVQDPVLTLPWSENRVFDIARLREELVSDAERRLTAVAAAHPGIDFTVEAIVGAPAETIVRTAAERGADLIIVGTHGRHGVSRMFMGSVAERVVRLATCPVLTVRDVLEAKTLGVPTAIAAHA
jgi:nucleotide-binding universal stress UspA family protein